MRSWLTFSTGSTPSIRRIREIGIRMALGERRGAVLRRVGGGAFRLALPGLLVGAAPSAVAGQLMAGFLIGTSPADPLALVLVAIAIVTDHRRPGAGAPRLADRPGDRSAQRVASA